MRLWLGFLLSGILVLPVCAQRPRNGPFNPPALPGGRIPVPSSPQPVPGAGLNGLPLGRPQGVTLNGLPIFSNRYPHYGVGTPGPHGGRSRVGYFGFVPLFDSYSFPSVYSGYTGYDAPPPPVDPTAMAITDEVDQLRGEVDQLKAHAASAQPAPEPPPSAEQTAPSPPEPATIIVLRDGRHLESTNYAVMDQTLWNFSARPVQKIPVSTIDMSASQKANADRGIDFFIAVNSVD